MVSAEAKGAKKKDGGEVFVFLPHIPQMLGADLPFCDSQHNWLPVSRGNQNPGAE